MPSLLVFVVFQLSDTQPGLPRSSFNADKFAPPRYTSCMNSEPDVWKLPWPALDVREFNPPRKQWVWRQRCDELCELLGNCSSVPPRIQTCTTAWRCPVHGIGEQTTKRQEPQRVSCEDLRHFERFEELPELSTTTTTTTTKTSSPRRAVIDVPSE